MFGILGADSLPAHTIAKIDSDSVLLATVREELAAARLNEANLRMEIEQMKLATYAADSVKLARQKQRIDSLRHQTQGVPVVVDGDTLFYLYAKRGGLTPQQRAENVSRDITALGKRFNLHPDSVCIESTDIVTDVMYDGKVLVSFTDQDGLWESCTRDQLAAAKRTVIVEKLRLMKEEHGFLQLCKRIAYFILVLVGQFLLFKLTNWLFRKLKVRILRLRNTRLKPFSIQDYELLDTQKQVRLLVFVANLFRYAVAIAPHGTVAVLHLPADQKSCLSAVLLYLESGEEHSLWYSGIHSQSFYHFCHLFGHQIPGAAVSLPGR